MKQKLDYKLPKEATIYRVLDADKLLGTNSHKKILERISKDLAGCNEKYNILYLPLIEGFAQYVQTLRDVSKKNNYRMLNLGLERAEFITTEFVKNKGDKYDHTYVFAVFSATLLLDIGRIDFLRRIHICNQDGAFIGEWEPILGQSIYKVAKYYKIRESVEEHIAMHNLISPILAANIVPAIGMVSLRNNQQLFAWWLAFLAKNENGKDAFANEMKIYNKKFLEKHTKQKLDDVSDEILKSEKLADSEKFWAWLKDKLKEDKSKVNAKDSKAHKVADGVYIDIESYAKEFCDKYSSKAASYALLAKQFNSLGVAKLSGADLQFEKHFGSKGGYKSSFMFKSSTAGSVAGSAINENGVILSSSQALIADVKGDNSKYVSNNASDVKIMQSNLATKTAGNDVVVNNLDPNSTNNT
jgi:hypothetical protein